MDTTTAPRHRVAVAVAHTRDELDAVMDASTWSMSTAEAGQTLVELHRVKAQVAELEARVAVHAEGVGVGSEEGASSAAVWVANRTRQTRPAAHGAVKLGRQLEAYPATREALAAGVVCEAQVRVILRWLDRLPVDLGAALVARAEQHLMDAAAEHDAKALGWIGRRLWEVIAPEEADAREAELLAREEAAAARASVLTGFDDGEGKTHFKGVMPSFHWAALQKALHALAAPQHLTARELGAVAHKPTPERLGQALCELIETIAAKDLPATGGVSATMTITLDHHTLTGDLEKAGVLDAGGRISPGMARRLACEAGIIPVVLGGESQVLDVGRKSRLFTQTQRIAVLHRQRGMCAAEGCDRTRGLHVHHLDPWSSGGKTDLAKALALCHWHHRRIHDTTYQATHLPHGEVRFHRRT